MKNIFKKLVLITFILLLYQNELIFAQAINNETDSLLKILNIVENPAKIDVLIKLSNNYRRYDQKQQRKYAEEAYKKALLFNDKRYIVKSLFTLTIVELDERNLDLAEEKINEILKINQELKDTFCIANSNRILGDIYAIRGFYSTSQKYYLESSNLFEKIKIELNKDKSKMLEYGKLFNNYGVLFADINDFESSNKYYKLASEAYKKAGDSLSLALIYYNIGISSMKISENDSALYYNREANKISKLLNYKSMELNTLVSQGELLILLKRYNEAKEVLDLAINQLEENKEYHDLAYAYIQKGNYFKAIEDNNSALEMFNKALKLSNEIDYEDYCLISYKSLAEIYELKNNYVESLNYYKKWFNLKDSLEQKQNALVIQELNKKFDYEKKENENSELLRQKEFAENNNSRLRIILALLFVLVIIGVFLINNLKKNQRLKDEFNKILESKNAELQENINTKNKFFSIIAHDLRNPLGSFKNVTLLLLDDYNINQDEDTKEFLEILNDSAQNLYKLLENLLEWSRSQSGKITFEPSDFNLNAIVNNNISLLSLQANDKEISLINNVPTNYILFADMNLITTVIRNLMSNAIKFTKAYGKIEIGILDNSNNETVVYIHDNGLGMNDATKNKLFKIEENVTNLGTNNEKGTGLGLILCKEFIDKHKGRIWVESELGVGSTFFFSIPHSLKNEITAQETI